MRLLPPPPPTDWIKMGGRPQRQERKTGEYVQVGRQPDSAVRAFLRAQSSRERRAGRIQLNCHEFCF
jgi:hypothetical protein